MLPLYRENIWIEEATELTQELVFENANKILQLKYLDKGWEQVRNRQIWKDFLTRTGFIFKKKKLTLAEQKEQILKLVQSYKLNYPDSFPKIGWYDKKVAKQSEATSL